MIKPDAVESGNIGNILQMISNAGFSIKAMKYATFGRKAKEFYAVMQKDHFMEN